MTTRNDATFYAPLTHSLIPTNGSGAPTLARSTAMWLYPDNEGKMVTVPASAAAFGGARMVANLTATTSEDLTNAVWSKVRTTASADAITINGITLDAVFETVDNNTHHIDKPSALVVGGSNTFSIYVAKLGRRYITVDISNVSAAVVFDLDLGAVNFTSGTELVSANIYDLTNGLYRLELIVSEIASASGAFRLWTAFDENSKTTIGYVGDVTKGFYASRQMNENTTGQVDKAASEYVSVGVESAPYHGAGIDGAKWLNTHKDGTPIPPSSLLGLATNDAAVTNTMLWCRDFTSAAWVKSNVTAAKTQIGLDNVSNSCSLITFTANGGTILQTITAAAAAGCTGWRVTRSVGTGNIYITRDGGTNWADVTSQIDAGTFTLVGIENTSVTNPVVGFKGDVASDAIIVDGGINHLGTKLYHLPILTTSAAITVGAQTLTYPTAGNISDTAGTILATVNQATWSDGGVVGSATTGLFSSTANKGAQSKDGTNTVTGPTGTPSGEERIGMRWSGSSMQSYSDAEFGAAGSYDGSLNLSTISIASGVTGYVRDVAIWTTSLADADMIQASGTVNILGTPATISISESTGNVLIGNVINGVVDQILMTCPDGIVIAGRTIDGVADTITMTAPAGSVLFDNAPRSTVSINGLYAQKTITAKL